ncbi:MAG: hypothetical protein ACWA5P_05830 [bacterium]
MITLENGVFRYGNPDGIIEIESKKNYDIDDYFDNLLTEDCWVLTIPRDTKEMGLFNPHDNELYLIPDELDYGNPYFELFWETDFTFLFASKEQAINFMAKYEGEHADEVRDFYNYLLERIEMEKVVSKYTCLCDLGNQVDEDLYIGLSEIIEAFELPRDIVMATIKSYILNSYREEMEQNRLSLLN